MNDKSREPTSAVLARQNVSVILDWSSGVPAIVHWGETCGANHVAAASDRPIAKEALESEPPISLFVEEASGFSGQPGVSGNRPDGSCWSPRFTLVGSPAIGTAVATFQLHDRVAELEAEVKIKVDSRGALVISSGIRNVGSTEYCLSQLAVSVPMPSHAQDLVSFNGRWCLEFQPYRRPFTGLQMVENRLGRTSHDHLPAMFTCTAGASEQSGEVWGLQLAWSGNYRLTAELLADGRRYVQASELLFPGEIVLAPGERYDAPQIVGAWSKQGFSAASQVFHEHLRTYANLKAVKKRPIVRPVILNTWEAVYLDHDLTTLKLLADRAALTGVERFVLDDGWFGGRRNLQTGLGDWQVSADVWPDGLHPLVDHVLGLGLEFGLWFEPEMVNPDSDLYRTHPEWTLTTDGYEPVLSRDQLMLDLGRADVRDYLFTQISALLDEYPISYIKWDMNRNIVQGSGVDGRPGTHNHVAGLYGLLKRLTEAHPTVEIESCASGGGRADLGILSHTTRIWTSDCNDALDRQSIQRGFSMLFPPEVMGAHLGPDISHTTGRRQPLGFRLANAIFGHFGIEWNLLEVNEADLQQVKKAVELHKRLRPLLHNGKAVRVDYSDPAALVHGVVSPESDEAIFAFVKLNSSTYAAPPPMRLAGLNPNSQYQVKANNDFDSIHDSGEISPSWISSNLTVSGQQLMTTGLQPPIMHPESILLIQLNALAD